MYVFNKQLPYMGSTVLTKSGLWGCFTISNALTMRHLLKFHTVLIKKGVERRHGRGSFTAFGNVANRHGWAPHWYAEGHPYGRPWRMASHVKWDSLGSLICLSVGNFFFYCLRAFLLAWVLMYLVEIIEKIFVGYFINGMKLWS